VLPSHRDYFSKVVVNVDTATKIMLSELHT